jgi:hypothetical protein
VRDKVKSMPTSDARVVRQVIETHVSQTNLGRHNQQDEMYRVLNPAMTDELMKNTISASELLRRLKPQLQAIAERK